MRVVSYIAMDGRAAERNYLPRGRVILGPLLIE